MTVAAAVDDTFWAVTLGMGAVVVAVVIVLMMMLLSLLKDIDTGVAALIQTGSEVSENTAAIAQLADTGPVLEMIKTEALVHDGYLESQL